MNPQRTQSALITLIVRGDRATDHNSALLDALFAVRRASWTPTRDVARERVQQ